MNDAPSPRKLAVAVAASFIPLPARRCIVKCGDKPAIISFCEGPKSTPHSELPLSPGSARTFHFPPHLTHLALRCEAGEGEVVVAW